MVLGEAPLDIGRHGGGVEVEEVVKFKRTCFRKWKKSGLAQDKGEYVKARRRAKKAVLEAKERSNKELGEELDSEKGKQKVFKIARQMARERMDVVKVTCVKDRQGRLILNEEGRKRVWKEYMEKLLNEEKQWDGGVDGEIKEGPECEINKEEVSRAMRRLGRGKAAGQSGVVIEIS
jgi:hypothetical protein